MSSGKVCCAAFVRPAGLARAHGSMARTSPGTPRMQRFCRHPCESRGPVRHASLDGQLCCCKALPAFAGMTGLRQGYSRCLKGRPRECRYCAKAVCACPAVKGCIRRRIMAFLFGRPYDTGCGWYCGAALMRRDRCEGRGFMGIALIRNATDACRFREGSRKGGLS